MNLEERVKKIEERNKKVELDKAWETSWTRKIGIIILTYVIVITYSFLIRKYNYILLTYKATYIVVLLCQKGINVHFLLFCFSYFLQ